MAAESAVTLVRIAIKPDVLGQKMLKACEAVRPSSVLLGFPENFFQPAVFVSGKSQRLNFRIDCSNCFQILLANI